MLPGPKRIAEDAMKSLQIVAGDGARLYSAMIRKQAEIRKAGRGTFMRSGANSRKGARWTHVRYKGAIRLKPGSPDNVDVEIKSPERGDEARLLSSFLGWLDRHFGKEISAVTIRYR